MAHAGRFGQYLLPAGFVDDQLGDVALDDFLRGLQRLAGTEAGFCCGDVLVSACVFVQVGKISRLICLAIASVPFRQPRFNRLSQRNLLADRRRLPLVVLVALDLQGVELVQSSPIGGMRLANTYGSSVLQSISRLGSKR